MEHIRAKLEDIHKDISNNVTKILDRPNIHLAYDLIYHSILQFKFEGRVVRKGWIEGFIVGDTKCGKTEAAECLIRHYKMGAIAAAENASYAGLVATCETVRGRWQITWGAIPFHNRRLLFIDEVSGMSHEDIGKMSSMRSSGIADITKAKTSRAEAKTRLAWISNPRPGHSVGHFDSGVALVRDLIGKPEDISRFDFVVIVSANEVDEDIVNAPPVVDEEPKYTSEMCHNLLMWAWTRGPNDVRFVDGAEEACRAYAKKMFTKYSKEFPIVNAGEQKLKLARLAVALAARLFSTDDYKTVLVKPEHVEYIHWWLNNEYDRPSFGYDVWSKVRNKMRKLKNEEPVMEILRLWGPSVVQQLHDTRQLHIKTLADATGTDDSVARTWASVLIQNGALISYHTYYFKSPALITLMKQYLNSPELLKEDF
jgi:hypothetical protein